MLTLVIALIVIYAMKRWLPNVYKLLKGLVIRFLKGFAGWLWGQAERKGGATIRQTRMRWRQ
ncbi:MAG: hypothetical protein K8I01_12705 [Candidatus Methylomirabilis sp.]|nr:hypothetical protein [Deltaproteobacteria bacterium]